jgi:hypothetical protein
MLAWPTYFIEVRVCVRIEYGSLKDVIDVLSQDNITWGCADRLGLNEAKLEMIDDFKF